MKRPFITLSQAAQRLQVSESSIRSYIRKGYLRSSEKKNEVLLKDVLILVKEREEAPPFDKTTFAKMCRELETVKSQLKAVLSIMNLKQVPLGLKDAEMVALYEMAQAHLEEGCPPGQEGVWAATLPRMQDEDLCKLERLMGDGNPWRPFYLLASQLFLSASRKPERSEFEIGRNHIRMLANIWIESRGNGVLMLDALEGATPLAKLFSPH